MTDFIGGRVPRRRRLLALGGLAVTVGAFVVSPATGASAHGGEYSLDFVASAPTTYDHTTGGGAYDDRTIGVNKDVVESLEGGDFDCNDIVTFLTRITRKPAPVKSPGVSETMELTYVFLADTTGQSGIAFSDIVNAKINYGAVSGGDGVGGTDQAIVDDGGSTAIMGTETFNKPVFAKGSKLTFKVQVTDLEAGETVILRIDVRLSCKANTSPTGNLQGDLTKATVLGHANKDTNVQVGAQTVPLKHVQDIYPLPTARFANVTQEIAGGAPAPAPAQSAAVSSQAASAPAQRSASTLPETGSSSALDLVQLGMMLATAGLVAVIATRRRAIAHRGRH